MRFLAIPAFAALLLCSSAALAQEGSYAGSGEGDLSATITHVESDIFDVDLSVVTPIADTGGGCAGGITGQTIMTKKGANLFVENEDYDPDATDSPVASEQYCEIKMSFTNGTLELEEQHGCLGYHGASCGFTGTLQLQK